MEFTDETCEKIYNYIKDNLKTDLPKGIKFGYFWESTEEIAFKLHLKWKDLHENRRKISEYFASKGDFYETCSGGSCARGQIKSIN